MDLAKGINAKIIHEIIHCFLFIVLVIAGGVDRRMTGVSQAVTDVFSEDEEDWKKKCIRGLLTFLSLSATASGALLRNELK